MEEKLKNKRVAILGLGVEGYDLVRFLHGKVASIVIHDQKPKADLSTEDIPKDIKFVCGDKYLESINDYDIIFRSPGVYRYSPSILEAEKKGAEVSSAVKLFFSLCPAKIIGVTGTKGKGTTSTLIFETLKESGKDVYLAGNIGKPPLQLLNDLKKSSWIVLELSSFQLIDMKESPNISVVLNITSDHMDWHKDRKEYIEAKANIVTHQKEDDFAVINADYTDPLRFARKTKAHKYYFSRKDRARGSYVQSGKIYLNVAGARKFIGETRKLLLRGEHNWENITAAICASSLAGASIDSIKRTVFSFKGLEHRLELAGSHQGITFYNDSFATGPQPTTAAVDSFHEQITLILGGYDKGLEYKDMISHFLTKSNLKNIILIGDLSGKLGELLIKSKFRGKMVNMKKRPMKEIVEKAVEITEKGGVILLSPAAASFDMFSDYKQRGNLFKGAVIDLKNEKL